MVAFTGTSFALLSGLSSLTATSAVSNFLDAGHVLRGTVCEEIATSVSSSSMVYYNGAYFPTKTLPATYRNPS
jgi:hypothetical protein